MGEEGEMEGTGEGAKGERDGKSGEKGEGLIMWSV